MKSRRYIIIFSLTGFLWACTPDENHSDSLQISGLQQADSLFDRGKYLSENSSDQSESVRLFKEALQIYRSNNDKYKEARACQYLGYAYDYAGKYDSVLYYQKKAARLFEQVDKPKLTAIAHNNTAIAFTIQGQLDSAFHYYDKALKITEKTRDTFEFVELYQNIGISYSYAGNDEKYIENTLKALAFAEAGDFSNNALALNLHVAQYYNENNDFDKAFEYLQKAAKFEVKATNKEALASLYNTFGEYYLQQNDYTQARKYFLKNLQISKEKAYQRGISAAYGNLAKTAMEDGAYKSAVDYAQKSLAIERQIDNLPGEISSLLILSKVEQTAGKDKKAFEHLQQAKAMCTANHLYEKLPEIYEDLSGLYKKNRQYKEALVNYERFHRLNDSLLNERQKEKISEMEVRFQTEQKQHKIELLKASNLAQEQKLKKKNLWLVILFLLFVLFVIFTYLYRQRIRRKMNDMNRQIQHYLLKIEELNCEKSKTLQEHLDFLADKFDLTEREKEVLGLISEGKTNKEIADAIYVSNNTVKFHIKNIYLKLDVKNRVEARNKVVV